MDCNFKQVGKFTKPIFTDKQVNRLLEVVSSQIVRVLDDGDENTKEHKELEKIYEKIVKAKNKTGSYFLWQLKDSDGDVNYENLKEKWR